jgi:hypothetical protein
MLSKLVKFLFVMLVLLSGAALALALVVVEDAPDVAARGTPSPEDVTTARRVVAAVKASAGTGPVEPLVVTEAEIESVLRLGVRMIPGFRGAVAVEPWGLEMRASVPVPFPGAQRWLNMAVSVPQFEGRVALGRVAVGPVSIPPALALELGRIGANMALGDGLGDTAIAAAAGMRVTRDTVRVDVVLDEVGENGLMRGVFGAMRGSDMPPMDLIDAYEVRIREAMDRGDLPERGSYLPYLVFTLNAAREGARAEGGPDAFTAAIFALTRICGAQAFSLVVGDMAQGGEAVARDWQTDCRRPTLNGRIDSRRHFTTAAAIQAASTRNVSVSVGEFKELYDTRRDGFDFTDLAANNSGIRLANLFMSTPVADWGGLIARIREERDVIVSFDDIPQILTRAEFAGRFGAIDSERYRAMVDRIERKIDALALHAP